MTDATSDRERYLTFMKLGTRLLVVLCLPIAAAALATCAATGGNGSLPDAASAGDASTTDASVVDPPLVDGGHPTPDAGVPQPIDSGPAATIDSGPSPAPDAGSSAPSVINIGDCAAASASCTCTDLGGAKACTHSFGGVYANLGCSGGFQCCDGAWRKGLSVCGACLCSDASGEAGCSPPDDVTAMCHPVFEGTAQAIPADVQEEMTGLSWKANLDCPAFSELRLLRLSYWNFDGGVSEGELVVHQSAVSEMLGVFEAMFDARFPIERMVRVDAYGADDNASMAANNTSAFNCRMTTSGTQLSQHSHGTAVDINPLNNPYVSGGGTVYPPSGAAYVDRGSVRKGMIVDPGPVVGAFDGIAWGWGGRWSNTKDYQHFSRNGL